MLYFKGKYESVSLSGRTTIARFVFCSSCMYTYFILTRTVEILHKPTQLFLFHLLKRHALYQQAMAVAASITHTVDTGFESWQLPCIMGPPEFCPHGMWQKTLYVTRGAVNDRYSVVPISSDHLHVLLPHWTSLKKLKSTHNLIENSKVVAAEHYTWAWDPSEHEALYNFLTARTWSQPFRRML